MTRKILHDLDELGMVSLGFLTRNVGLSFVDPVPGLFFSIRPFSIHKVGADMSLHSFESGWHI